MRARGEAAWRLGLRRLWLALALGSCVWLWGCGGGCSNLDGPEFEDAIQPADAVVGQAYRLELSVDILRTVFESAYGFAFYSPDLLPPGLRLEHIGTGGRVQIVGVPTLAGTYKVRVAVNVSEPTIATEPDADTLCWTDAETTVTIVVKPG